jgi:hypothetical protein
MSSSDYEITDLITLILSERAEGLSLHAGNAPAQARRATGEQSHQKGSTGVALQLGRSCSVIISTAPTFP